MRIILFLSIYANFLFSDNIGNVEYQPPSSAKNWKISHHEKTSKEESIQYSNENKNVYETFIAVSVRKSFLNRTFPSLDYTQESEKELKNLLESDRPNDWPKYSTTVEIIEKSPNSIFYKWTFSLDNREVEYRWKRKFQDSQRITSLSYSCGKKNSGVTMNEFETGWIQTIKHS